MAHPIVSLLLDAKVIDLLSTLVAKLEHIRYDETRRGVFRTPWGASLFSSSVRRLKEGEMTDFDIDEWYAGVVDGAAGKNDFEISPARHIQDVDTNWLGPLLEVEIKVPGFVNLLHNLLELEDQSHSKMAEKARKEDQYDFLGVGTRNRTLLLTGGGIGTRRKQITSSEKK